MIFLLVTHLQVIYHKPTISYNLYASRIVVCSRVGLIVPVLSIIQTNLYKNFMKKPSTAC